MLASLLIVFREVFEAGLVVGIVMAVTSAVPGRTIWIAGGVGAGVLGACLVALFTSGLSELFNGSGQEVFNASILGVAVVMLTWHNVWMSRHGRELVAELHAPAGKPIVIHVKNLNTIVSEFESSDLHFEKIVPVGSEGVVYVRPQQPGRYNFFDDFHHETQGSLVVQ